MTGLVCTDFGNAAVSALPTLAFTNGGGSGAAATVIMCWTITAVAAPTGTNQGAGLAGSYAWVTAQDNFPTGGVGTNTKYQNGLVNIRMANIQAAISSGNISGTPVIYDGGIYTSSPTILVMPSASVVTTAPVLTYTLGGTTGHSYVIPTGS